MRKICTIAAREYRAMVGTKAFVISIAMMPLLMFGGLLAMRFLKNVGQLEDRKIAIIDLSGEFHDAIQSSANFRNAMLESEMSSDKGAKDDRDEPFAFSRGHMYRLQRIDAEQLDDQRRLELSDLIRSQQLYAFVEIPAKTLQEVQPGSTAAKVKFYSQDASLSKARGWISRVINERATTLRLEAAGIDPQVVRQASRSIVVQGLGLLAKSADGKILAAEEKDELSSIFLPMGVMMLMFMVIFLASQPMLESVLEEKSQRIAEVLLGSANPFQLMAGKLLGTVGGSLTVFGFYFLGAVVLAERNDWIAGIPFHIAPWFIAFQICGVLFFAAVFMAVGASVSQLKEAQSMLLPVWLVMMSPMFIWFFAVQEPNGALATWFSFFPPATPTMMMLRLATGTTIPFWQPLVGLLILVLFTVFIVYVAARIFRIGLLWQGKSPKMSDLLQWIVATS